MLAKHALSQLSYGPVPEDECFAGMPSRSSRQLARSLACPAEARVNQPAFAHLGFGVAALTRSRERRLVGLGRLELPTSRLSSARSNQLSYKPLTLIPSKGSGACSRASRLAPDAIAQALSPWRVFVREERETKTAKSRQWSSTILKLLAPDVSKTIR
jgi:hypothetical protein